MAVVSITITESSYQVISGIPQTVSLAANIPSSIFYTLDGTVPTTMSNIYVGPIKLPTNNSSVTLNVFATDGVDSSSVITQVYSPVINVRKYGDTVIGLPTMGPGIGSSFPYGDFSPNSPVPYGPSGGLIVNDESLPQIPDGYDGMGGISNSTNLPLDDYTFIYSTTDSEGQTGKGIGNLPATVTVVVPTPANPSSSSNMSSPFFDPRAMVMYQDSSIPPYDNVSQLNRQNFSLGDKERASGGAAFQYSATDAGQVTGNFIKSHYNPTTNEITYYYRDRESSQWIISKELYTPTNPDANSLSYMVFARTSDKVFKWLPFASRKLI